MRMRKFLKVTMSLSTGMATLVSPLAHANMEQFEKTFSALAGKQGFYSVIVQDFGPITNGKFNSPIKTLSGTATRDANGNKNMQTRIATASNFKLYVLKTLAEDIRNGRLSWSDRYINRSEYKSLYNRALFKPLSNGEYRNSALDLKFVAKNMMRISDNTATDMLINVIAKKEQKIDRRSIIADVRKALIFKKELVTKDGKIYDASKNDTFLNWLHDFLSQGKEDIKVLKGRERILYSMLGYNTFLDMNYPFMTTMDLWRMRTRTSDEVSNYLRLTPKKQNEYLTELAENLTWGRTYSLLMNGDSSEKRDKFDPPRDIRNVEWYATTGDLCKTARKLIEYSAADRHLFEILTVRTPFGTMPNGISWVGMKDGNESGVETYTIFMKSAKNGHWGCVSMGINDPVEEVNSKARDTLFKKVYLEAARLINAQ